MKKINFPVGTKQKKYPVKVSRKAPIRGQSKNTAIYHETRGKKGRV